MIELAITVERFPLRIHPNFDGSRTTDRERRIGEVSYDLPIMVTANQNLNWEVLRVARGSANCSLRACASILISGWITG
jgi:hypothetical protein